VSFILQESAIFHDTETAWGELAMKIMNMKRFSPLIASFGILVLADLALSSAALSQATPVVIQPGGPLKSLQRRR
jgi:hypothetical protein